MESRLGLIAQLSALCFCVLGAPQGHAQITSGFMSGPPTWVRPQPDGLSLSTVTAAYRATAFKVSTTGNYSFTAETHGTFDNVEFLYNSSFNASTPLTGLLRGVNAAGFGGTESMTAIALTSNTLYYVVTTGFSATDAGPYVLTFSGPSSVTQVFPPPLTGDYNRDNRVDAADYVLWRKTLNASVTFFAGADGNGSGAIDSGDYDVLRANFGRAGGSGSGTAAGTAVPEPRDTLFAVATILAICRSKSLRRRAA